MRGHIGEVDTNGGSEAFYTAKRKWLYVSHNKVVTTMVSWEPLWARGGRNKVAPSWVLAMAIVWVCIARCQH